MEGMFGYCYSLIKLDLSSFNTQNVKYVIGMFDSCTSLISMNHVRKSFNVIKNKYVFKSFKLSIIEV